MVTPVTVSDFESITTTFEDLKSELNIFKTEEYKRMQEIGFVEDYVFTFAVHEHRLCILAFKAKITEIITPEKEKILVTIIKHITGEKFIQNPPGTKEHITNFMQKQEGYDLQQATDVYLAETDFSLGEIASVRHQLDSCFKKQWEFLVNGDISISEEDLVTKIQKI